MPRTARLNIPGLLQHVIVRGIEKRPIFLDDEDRTAFVERFLTLLVETSNKCYLAVRKLTLKGMDVGETLCLGPSGVSLAIRRGERLILEHPEVVEQALALDHLCFPIDLSS